MTKQALTTTPPGSKSLPSLALAVVRAMAAALDRLPLLGKKGGSRFESRVVA